MELDEWPKTTAIDRSASVMETTNGEDDEDGVGSDVRVEEKGALQLPASMVFARSLLDEMKDPLGTNDALYQ